MVEFKAEQKTLNDLKFLHIPKTGGSSISLAGRVHQLKWAVNDKGYLSSFKSTLPKQVDLRHVPLDCFEKGNPYVDYDVFVSIRNPIERIISAYNFNTRNRKGTRSVGALNKWIVDNLELAKTNPYVHTCFLLPMNRFIYYDDPEKYKVHHILRFENLKEDYENLMNKYGSNMKFENVHCFKSDSGFTRNDLTPETISAIKDFYRKDFELWYPEELKN